VGIVPPSFSSTFYQASLTVSQSLLDQLTNRQVEYPIDWETTDYLRTWLVPHRLLIYINIANPDPDWADEIQLTINNLIFPVKMAFETVHPNNDRFMGYYVDVSDELEAGVPYTVALTLPQNLHEGQFLGLFLENIEPRYTNEFSLSF